MTFIWPYALITLTLIPLFYWLYRRLLKQRAINAADLGPLGRIQNRSGQDLSRRKHIPPALFLIGLTFLLFSTARPEMVLDLPRIEGTVILAFDVSSSMLAKDLEPTRIDAAKAAARAFVQNQPPSVRIGVVAFSNGGFIVQAPTDNQADILAAIDRLTATGQTSLGQGIFTSLGAITDEPIPIDIEAFEQGEAAFQIESNPSAVIMLLSDGENTSNLDPLTIAQAAADASIRIYPIGIGSPEGTVLDIDGFSVLTQLNEQSLEQIASLTNGTYYYAADSDALQEIYETIDLRLAIRGETTEVTAIFVGLGVLFFLIGGTLSMLWFGRIP